MVAETFLVAWRRIDRVPIDPLPWLLRTASNVIANQLRAERRRMALQAKACLALDGASGPDPAEDIGSKQFVLDLLSRLPKAEREALLLTVWEGLGTRQGASALGCSRSAFAVRLHRARKRLARELGAEAPPGRRDNSFRRLGEVEAK